MFTRKYENRLFPHSCKQRHQREARVDKIQWFVWTSPFTANHSRGTKSPCWRANVALGQDRQRKLPFRIMYAFYLSCPSATFALQDGGCVPCEWLAAKGAYCPAEEPRPLFSIFAYWSGMRERSIANHSRPICFVVGKFLIMLWGLQRKLFNL